MNFRWIAAPLASMLVLLTIAACGGDDKSPSTSASASATNSPVDSETPETTSTVKRTATPKKTATPKGTETATPAGVVDTTPEIDECELVTLDDLSTATGEAFTKDGTLDGDSCSWDGAAGANAKIVTYNLSSYGAGSEKEFFETFANIFGATILDSPGDEAYYDDTVGISVLDGKYELDVSLTAANGKSDRTATFALAEKALANMP